jgi:hypothetical protein
MKLGVSIGYEREEQMNNIRPIDNLKKDKEIYFFI